MLFTPDRSLVLSTRPPIVLPGLTGWYTFDDGAATDYSGSQNVGALASSPSVVAGILGYALKFTGGSHVNLGANASTAIPFSYFAWINPTSLVTGAIIGSSTVSAGPEFRLNSTGTIQLLKQNVSNVITSAATVPAGVWSHVGVGTDGSNGYVWVNGTRLSVGISPTFTFANLWVGSAGNSDNFNGAIDEVRIYNRVLSIDEVLAIIANDVSVRAGAREEELPAIRSTATAYSASIAETASAADTPSAAWHTADSIAESVTAADAPSVGAALSAAIAETVTAADALSAGAALNAAIAESVTAADTFSSGAMDRATVAESVSAADVTDASFVFLGLGRIFSGVIGDVTLNRRGLVTFQARGLLSLGRGIVTERYGPMCRNDLGDDSTAIGSGGTCMIPILMADVQRSTAYILKGSAITINQAYVRARAASAGDPSDYANTYYECTTAGTTAGSAPTYDPIAGHTTTDGSAVFTARNAWLRCAKVAAVTGHYTFTLQFQPDSRDVDDWFALGEGIVRSGTRSGSPFHMKAYTQSTKLVTCFHPIDDMLAAGYWVEMSPGCDKTPTMCNVRYANGLNYHGERFVPGRDLPLTQA